MGSEWRNSTWGDEISLEYGKSLRGYDQGKGRYRVFGSNGPIGWTHDYLAPGPGVVLGRKGAYRGVEFSREPFFVIDTAYYVAPKTDLDLRWLYFAIKHHRLGEIDDGSPVPSTTRAAVYMHGLAVPPPEEQRAIAHILGTLDDKIELNRRMGETLEAMAHALFRSWFVDFEPVRLNAGELEWGSAPAVTALFPTEFVDSEIGSVPSGWEISFLNRVAECVKGRSYRSEELVESDTALVTLKSFARGGGYRSDGLKPFVGSYKPEQIVESGDVVVACTDVTQAAEVIGRSAIVRGSGRYRTLVASLDTLVIRPVRPLTTKAFLYCLGRTDAFVAHTYAHTTGTTVLHLSKEAVPSFAFAQPPAVIVQQFDQLVSPWLAQVQTLADQSDTLAALRDTLLPKLISGELRVRDAEPFVGQAV